MLGALLTAVTIFYNAPQSVVSTSIATQSVQTASANSQTISVSFKNTRLPDAIKEISRQANVPVMYSEVVVPANHMVTYSASSISVENALRAVLRNTGVIVQSAGVGGYRLAKAASKFKAQGVITGRVVDAKSGKSVSGASVSIGNDMRSTVTGEDGVYRLANVAPGTHTLNVRLVGYAKQTRSVTVGEGASITADFKLEPSASVLNEVIVTGTIVSTELKAVPSAITVVTAKQIEERGITRIDQLFRGDIPGLFSLNLGSSAALDKVLMFSRGATSLTSEISGGSAGTDKGTNPIKTYIDGVEMADAQYLSQIDPKSIERIEILTGPQASTIYGAGAINGVMQIFTKRGGTSRPQINLGVSTGVAQNNFNNHLAPSYVTDASLSGVEGTVSYNVGGSWNYSGAWTPSKRTQRLSTNGGGRIELGKITADISARRGITQNKQNGSQLEGQSEIRANGTWLPDDVIGLSTPTTDVLLGQTFGFSLSYRPLSWWSHEVGIGSDASTAETITTAMRFGPSRSESDTTVSITPSTKSRKSERYSTTMQIPLASLVRINLTMGGDHWRTRGSNWNDNALSLTGALPSPFVSRTRPARNSGAFVQGQFAIKDALFLTYGVRADWNPNYGDNAKVKPGRYGVSYARDFGMVSAKLRGSYGRSIRPPQDHHKVGSLDFNGDRIATYGQYYSLLANPDLGPEHQQGGEGGIELYFGSRGSLVVTRYNQTVDNLISLVGASIATSGVGLDSVRSLAPCPTTCNASSTFRDADGHAYRYQRQYLNIGSIRNQGWELTGSFNLGPLTTNGTYSWTKSRVLGITPEYQRFLTGSTFTPGRPFDFVPEHTWALGVTYALSQTSVALSVNGTGMRYSNSDGTTTNELRLATDFLVRDKARMPRAEFPSGYRPHLLDYATADLNASHRFSSRMDATLQVTNLTNYYQNDFNIQNAVVGRQTKLGARIRW